MAPTTIVKQKWTHQQIRLLPLRLDLKLKNVNRTPTRCRHRARPFPTLALRAQVFLMESFPLYPSHFLRHTCHPTHLLPFDGYLRSQRMALSPNLRQRPHPLIFHTRLHPIQMVRHKHLLHHHPPPHPRPLRLLRLSHLLRSLHGHQYLSHHSANLDITKTIIDDIDGWGIGKIKGEKNFSQSALSDYSKMYNQTIH